MHRTFIALATFAGILFVSCQNNGSSHSYTITGTIENSAEGDTVMLQDDQDQNLVELERTYIQDGKFTFTGRQDSTVERVITYIKNGVKMGAVFFLENGNIQMNLTETSSITGTKSNDLYQTFLNQVNGIYGQISKVNAQYTADNLATDTLPANLSNKVKELDKKANDLIIKTIQTNIDNPVGFYLFRKYNYLLKPELQYYLISKMPVSWRRTSAIEEIKTQLDLLPQDSISKADFE